MRQDIRREGVDQPLLCSGEPRGGCFRRCSTLPLRWCCVRWPARGGMILRVGSRLGSLLRRCDSGSVLYATELGPGLIEGNRNLFRELRCRRGSAEVRGLEFRNRLSRRLELAHVRLVSVLMIPRASQASVATQEVSYSQGGVKPGNPSGRHREMETP
ncbi:hypothetical protein KC19_5G152500 [Ceratodon purpureus]|uniref:Uncharacterized protein n=1 Tax=Ceratodon purpureus TaxID=3225 RepID=A0A8T0I4A4_CERPU|nr:hypothetical protein KC19_5G152500 [Ceratodon purpureus]